MNERDIERSQRKLEALFPIHWLMEGSTMRTRVGNLLVSTALMLTGMYDGSYETMIFRCNDKGKVTDWHDLFCLHTHDEVVGHENGIAWAKRHIMLAAYGEEPNSQGTTDAEAKG